jgi:hydroxymethylpyrimidine/phosphomethylpyrimidine kinase
LTAARVNPVGTARPRLLVCAGHDPSGGAGVDADREAAAAAGATVRCVVTTDTEQDGRRVFAVRPRAAELWAGEARGVWRAESCGALKFGLLADGAAVQAAAGLAREAAERGVAAVVVDPVLAASGGERFLDPAGVRVLLAELVPADVVLTPNLLELAELTGASFEALAADGELRLRAAEQLLDRGARAVVAKGGHGAGAVVHDLVLARGEPAVWIERVRVPGRGLHGSGCRHASYLAARLAAGDTLPAAARAAGAYVAARIAAG